MNDKAQSSLEYMVMLALSLSIFTMILYVVSTLISSASTQLSIDATFRAVEEIREAADFVYIHGVPSRVKINVYFPPNVYNVSIYANKVINARLDVTPNYTDIYSVVRGNISVDNENLNKITHEGYYVIYVESLDSYWVNITVE